MNITRALSSVLLTLVCRFGAGPGSGWHAQENQGLEHVQLGLFGIGPAIFFSRTGPPAGRLLDRSVHAHRERHSKTAGDFSEAQLDAGHDRESA